MHLSNTFMERIHTTTSPACLMLELDTIRRLIIEEDSPSVRDELCTKQRCIQSRIYELEAAGSSGVNAQPPCVTELSFGDLTLPAFAPTI